MAGLLDFLLGKSGQEQPQQPASPQQGGGIGDFLSSIAPAVAMIDPRNQQLGAALMQMQQDRQTQRSGQQRQNQTIAWLQRQGLSPEDAAATAGDKELLKSFVVGRQNAGKPDWQITEIYDENGRAKKVLIDKNNPQNMRDLGGPKAASGADGVEYGLNPIWGQDGSGNPVLGVLGKDGSFKKVDTGQFNISTGTEQIDLGDSFALKDKRSGQIIGTVPKNLANAESEKAQGKAQGEAAASYKSMNSKLPGLEKVVADLGQLADEATYTTAGQTLDWLRKETGMAPRDSALARSKYIAMVDNQILPMLRDTFGAAFTQKEGETLRATLGNPDASPAEKKTILKAFIEQKKRDVQALGSQGNVLPEATLAPTPNESGIVDYSDYFKQ